MLYFIPTPIGNLGDITLNAIDAFIKSKIIICEDTRVTKRLLFLLEQKKCLNFDYKNKVFMSFHSHNEDEFLNNLDIGIFNFNVAFCTDAGMPLINDPGSALIKFAKTHKIKYEILLGGSAYNLAFAYSGLEGSFSFQGFLPHKESLKIEKLKLAKKLLPFNHLIFYESPKRLIKSLEIINSLMPDSKIYAYKELTKLYFREYIGTPQKLISDINENNVIGEWCFILKSKPCEELLTFNKNDVLSLDIKNKEKAKLLSKITSIDSKTWYKTLQENRY